MRPDRPVVSTYETNYWSEFKSPWNPKNWSRRTWLIAGTMTALLVVAIIATAIGVRVTRDKDGGNSSYPDYFKLNYTLVDTCELKVELCLGCTRSSGANLADSGTSFFDKFNYFTGYDPGMFSINRLLILKTNKTAQLGDSCTMSTQATRRNM
jgi:hypothetical protein